MEYIYLFEAHDNGYGINCDRTYFSSDKPLTQELVDELIKNTNPIAGRVGSNFEDLVEGAAWKLITIRPLKGQHKVENTFHNIIGNY
jgi:hypothetical protein